MKLGEQVVERWRGLAEHLITKYNDGYVKDENARAQDSGYPEGWYREVLKSGPGKFRLAPADSSSVDWKLVD